MNKTEFCERVAYDTQSSKAATKAWGDAILDGLAKAIVDEECVTIRGLGVFEHVIRGPKVGRNYKTGERVEIPPRIAIKFTPCKEIEDTLKARSDPEELREA